MRKRFLVQQLENDCKNSKKKKEKKQRAFKVQHPVQPHTTLTEAHRNRVSAAEHDTRSRKSHCTSVKEK